MDDFGRFLADRYREAEAMAKAASTSPKGKWGPRLDEVFGGHLLDDAGEVVVYDEGAPGPWQFDHIAANDPAHRLADIKLKRAILAEHEHVKVKFSKVGAFGCHVCDNDSEYGMNGDGWCATVRQLGTEFSDHPDYRPEWAPEGAPDGT